MTCLNPSMLMPMGKHASLISRASGLKRVLCSIECHRWHGNLWVIYKSGVQLFEFRVSCRRAKGMTIGVNYNVDKVGIEETNTGLVKCRILEVPFRRPLMP